MFSPSVWFDTLDFFMLEDLENPEPVLTKILPTIMTCDPDHWRDYLDYVIKSMLTTAKMKSDAMVIAVAQDAIVLAKKMFQFTKNHTCTQVHDMVTNNFDVWLECKNPNYDHQYVVDLAIQRGSNHMIKWFLKKFDIKLTTWDFVFYQYVSKSFWYYDRSMVKTLVLLTSEMSLADVFNIKKWSSENMAMNSLIPSVLRTAGWLTDAWADFTVFFMYSNWSFHDFLPYHREAPVSVSVAALYVSKQLRVKLYGWALIKLRRTYFDHPVYVEYRYRKSRDLILSIGMLIRKIVRQADKICSEFVNQFKCAIYEILSSKEIDYLSKCNCNDPTSWDSFKYFLNVRDFGTNPATCEWRERMDDVSDDYMECMNRRKKCRHIRFSQHPSYESMLKNIEWTRFRDEDLPKRLNYDAPPDPFDIIIAVSPLQLS